MKENNKRKGLWIPIEILNDVKLDGENKILLAEICSLSKLENGCTASNAYFGKLLGKNSSAASKRISKLEKMEYISTEKVNQNKQCLGRKITPSKKLASDMKIPEGTSRNIENRSSPTVADSNPVKTSKETHGGMTMAEYYRQKKLPMPRNTV